MAEALKVLQVIDRLAVGSPRITPRGLAADYRITRDGETASTELSYRYEEDVFDPGEPASRNLAAMIAAQVALNYGLFCREIVFEGEYDAVDRRFIEQMAENTAREIYVKKFLQPNEFLRGDAARLPVEKRKSYVQAALRFDGPEPGPTPPWPVERLGHAVLSSGGKDSLLTFGLLRELGLEPHPLFVNESGRHWHTALNAYRHFAAEWKSTARVWSNCDRVFSWMLRQLPFVRPDFADVRSDEYPIRLWTVAVFLFGALPLLRRRGLGRILIGDEYDTTVKVRHEGIPHHDGLYDQSRYFDDALTRYYRRKRWRVCQFSVLRPLSELLIEKILVERYPELQQHQVSCHATHVDDGRVHPCGRCEKCRRIVGMLVALGADASRCGYTPEQVEAGLRSLAERGAHQETEGIEHLLWMLVQQGKIAADATAARSAREHPEIERMRFDPRRSPPRAVPLDLRAPLQRIFLEHAAGTVQRSGRVWVPYDPQRDPEALQPYPLEAPEDGVRPEPERDDYYLGTLTWPQAKQRFRETDIALLPVGAVEQHGRHLPLDIDAWDADHLARRVAARCRPPRPLVFPLIPYGVSYHHADFPGTLSVSPETLSRVVYEIGIDAARHGITKLVIINGHGGNVPTLQYAAQMINRDAHIFTCVDTGDTSDADVAKLIETADDLHAGEIETSTALATRPELVYMDKARKCIPQFSSKYLNFSSSHSVEWYARTSKISRHGVLGDPTKASREKGEKIWEVMIEHLVAFVESLRGMTLDEIYERRL